MSHYRLSAPLTGTGTVTVQVPETNTDRTLTLPDSDGALARTADTAVGVEGYFFRSYQMTGGNDVSVGVYAGSSDATERRTLNIPPMLVNINGAGYSSAATVTKDINSSANWDNSTYATPANRAGQDFYLYACEPTSGDAPEFVLSANSTYPVGYDADTSRKIGGFHCLCVNAGTIADAPDASGYLAGDIIPPSVWDLDNRSASGVQEGFARIDTGQWVAIYLPSVSGGELVSVYGGTIADGTSTEAFHAYKFDQWFGRIGQKPIASMEFVVASLGSNQGTNISGSADPGTTGGHTDTAGRRMISNRFIEDMCGVSWQWGREHGGPYSSSSWVNAYDGNDSGVAGQHYNAPNRPRFGADWADGAICGSRSSWWYRGPLYLHSTYASRACAEPKIFR